MSSWLLGAGGAWVGRSGFTGLMLRLSMQFDLLLFFAFDGILGVLGGWVEEHQTKHGQVRFWPGAGVAARCAKGINSFELDKENGSRKSQCCVYAYACVRVCGAVLLSVIPLLVAITC